MDDTIEYLTVKQVAERLGVDVKTVYAWITKRKLRSKDLSNQRGRKDKTVREHKLRRVHVSEVNRVLRLISLGLPV